MLHEEEAKCKESAVIVAKGNGGDDDFKWLFVRTSLFICYGCVPQ